MISSVHSAKTVSRSDMMGRVITVPIQPKKIVSLVPSLTELVVHLTGEDKLVGKTKFCIHPSPLKNVTNIGGTKNPNIEKIKALKPDLIIANKEENRKEDIELLQQYFPVWVSDVNNVTESLYMIEAIAQLLNQEQKGKLLLDQIKHQLAEVKHIFAGISGKQTIYFIWYKPWMMAGKDTFISDLLHHIGLYNACEQNRYPEFLPHHNQHIDLIMLSSEPFPFKAKHVEEMQLLYPNAKILLIDGEMFSWYGSRLLRFSSYIKYSLMPKLVN